MTGTTVRIFFFCAVILTNIPLCSAISVFKIPVNELPDTVTARKFKETADSLVALSKRVEAIPYYRKAEMLYANLNIPELRADALNRLIFNLIYTGSGNSDVITAWKDTLKKVVEQDFNGGGVWRARLSFLNGVESWFRGDYDASVNHIRQGLIEAENTDIDWNLLVSFHRYQALNYNALFQFGNEEKELKKSLEIAQAHNASPEKTAWDLHMLCVLNVNYLGDLAAGLSYGKQALNAYLANPAKNREMIIQMYLSLGSIYRRYEYNDIATQYYQKAENMANQFGIHSPSILKSLYYQLGAFHKIAGNYATAMDYFNRIIQLETQNQQDTSINTCWHIAQTQYYMHQYENSAFWAEQTLKKARLLPADPLGYAFRANNILGNIYLSKNQIDSALNRFHVARNGFLSIYGKKHPSISYSCSSIAQCFSRKQWYDSALLYIQEALTSNHRTFTNPLIHTNPESMDASDPAQLILDLDFKANLLARKTASDSALKIAANTWMLTAGLIDTMTIGMLSTADKLLFSNTIHDIYDHAIETLFRFYQSTGNIEFLDQAFVLSEKAKATNLLNALRTKSAIRFASVPQVFQDREKQINNRLGNLKEILREEQNREKPDQKKIMMVEEGLFNLQRQRDSLIRVLENEYPNYYRLKYNAKVVTPDETANKLSDREAMISYHITNDTLIAFLITPDDFKVNANPVDSSFFVNLHSIRDYYRTAPVKRNKNININALQNNLYAKLIAPFGKEIRGKDLIIIPDGLLSAIPFDLLFSSDDDPSGSGPEGFPSYLLFQHSISYEYSATLYAEKNQNSNGVISKVLAFAPEYGTQKTTNITPNQYRQQDSLVLNPLPWAKQEIKYIKKWLPGKVISGNRATEFCFKKEASGYDILHLSMHTVLNDRDPMYSKLVFSGATDTIEDGYLNTWELYNLSLKAKIAVLSACNTGAGMIHHGEGIMSLARGFKFAGVPILVTTGWEIEDHSGSEIMRLFYRYLRKGQPVNTALKNAKITFLQNTDRLHADPYFWAGFSIIGKPDKILHPWNTLIMVFLVLGVASFAAYRTRAKSGKNESFIR